jgi:hypothetical protein
MPDENCQGAKVSDSIHPDAKFETGAQQTVKAQGGIQRLLTIMRAHEASEYSGFSSSPAGASFFLENLGRARGETG